MDNPLSPSEITQVVLLGTGTPIADPLRSGPAVAVVVNGQPYLVDFGPGVVRRAAAAAARGVEGLRPPKLTRAFATHLHSDHTAGYPDLLLTPGVVGRQEPLLVYGPPGILDMTDHILSAYSEDLRERIEGLEPVRPGAYDIKVYEIKPGPFYKDDNVQVTAFNVRHGTWPAFGFRFTTPDRTVVISGDTAPVDSLVEHARGCDILVHEVYAKPGFDTRSPEWQAYHASVHTSGPELGDIAAKARPSLLVLYHQLFWGSSEEDLLAEVRARYSGAVVSGNDLDVF